MGTTLRRIEESDLEQIMHWRMDPDITRYMNTDPQLTIEGQKEWLKRIEADDTVMYWLIETDGIPSGIICLIQIDWKNKTSSWGYYIGEKKSRSLKQALQLEMSLYDFVFDELGFDSLHNEVFALNAGVIKLHEACGSSIVRVCKDEISKNGESYDIVHINIDRAEWESIRGNKKYDKIEYPLFMRVHHIGYAVNDIEKSASVFQRLGYHRISELCDDVDRGVTILFLRHSGTGEVVELVASMGQDNPVTGQLQRMNQMASAYHMCYEVHDLEQTIAWLKRRGFHPIDRPSKAPAIDGRRVSFLIHRDAGMVELLETERK